MRRRRRCRARVRVSRATLRRQVDHPDVLLRLRAVDGKVNREDPHVPKLARGELEHLNPFRLPESERLCWLPGVDVGLGKMAIVGIELHLLWGQVAVTSDDVDLR